MDVGTLVEIEKIKQLKARYFRLLDTKKWDDWADVFTPDLNLWVQDVPDVTYTSRDEFLAAIVPMLTDAVTTHHGHMPEIDVTGSDTARGIWAMFDYVQLGSPDRPIRLKGYGHYHEEYRKGSDGQWRISSLRLHRLRVDYS
ncbi:MULTISPECIES: nuclear transport factor 2 family protein [unclassified Pseudofrankia]|uniref:nuclear transport factor 2 family protein n=1 Tax=unclassified Pseudofrankia TaxID=2994372 RepID=UPI0008D9F15E|nr:MULTISPECIES: nuclear transport factor 2 family protein [unclassified Pseudofrankia]MDT3445409.1 nuclear transport factor 2 family protein [Pseudofrankia sp. BMG5.37]OHV64708.1 hypothetical protein BCD48_37175 [Pseudofrankia sp. BMG5.36]